MLPGDHEAGQFRMASRAGPAAATANLPRHSRLYHVGLLLGIGDGVETLQPRPQGVAAMIAGPGEQARRPRRARPGGLLQDADQRQRRFLLQQVGAQRLAHRRLVAQHVQQVVGDLEGDAQFAGRTGPGRLPASARPRRSGRPAGSSRRSGRPSCRR